MVGKQGGTIPLRLDSILHGLWVLGMRLPNKKKKGKEKKKKGKRGRGRGGGEGKEGGGRRGRGKGGDEGEGKEKKRRRGEGEKEGRGGIINLWRVSSIKEPPPRALPSAGSNGGFTRRTVLPLCSFR